MRERGSYTIVVERTLASGACPGRLAAGTTLSAAPYRYTLLLGNGPWSSLH